MSEFFTWEYLITFAGAMTATGILTQFIKGLLDKVVHIPTQLLAYIIALAVLLIGAGFGGTLTPSTAALSFLNAVLIATATSGTVDGLKRVGR